MTTTKLFREFSVEPQCGSRIFIYQPLPVAEQSFVDKTRGAYIELSNADQSWVIAKTWGLSPEQETALSAVAQGEWGRIQDISMSSGTSCAVGDLDVD